VREFGIRMALGAKPEDILRLVLAGATHQLVVGVGLGLGLAVVLARGVASLLFNVSPADPLVFAAVSLILVTICITATMLPALQAAAVDPLEALRSE
jgi:ABC-type antimicrobial peptide transport system permease subunit